jgi:hypothetical protein
MKHAAFCEFFERCKVCAGGMKEKSPKELKRHKKTSTPYPYKEIYINSCCINFLYNEMDVPTKSGAKST